MNYLTKIINIKIFALNLNKSFQKDKLLLLQLLLQYYLSYKLFNSTLQSFKGH